VKLASVNKFLVLTVLSKLVKVSNAAPVPPTEVLRVVIRDVFVSLSNAALAIA